MQIKLLLVGTMLTMPIAGHAACTLTQADCAEQMYGDCGPNTTGTLKCFSGKLNTATCLCESETEVYYTCAAGYYGAKIQFGTPNCTPCPKGTYSDNMGATSCTTCESGGTTSGTGATSKSECCLTSNSFSDDKGSGTYTSACCQS